ncbi:hypothetical protein KAR91_83415, partial [Candidatus Pacearchaeota archaeon]|nr:hypothetical protein [Candidatus Pacearchaeota archaeon]
MNSSDIKEIIEAVVGGAEEIKPVIRNAIKATDEYLLEIQPSIERLQVYAVDSACMMVKRAEGNGFKRHEAIEIVGNLIGTVR